MPIPSNPPFLSNVLGYAADVSVIPGTTPSGSGAFSYQSAFPQITAIPLTAGGVAPMREDFNAVFKLLSQHVHFLQSGSLYPWSASLDYLVGAHVLGSDGKEYIAQKSSGPDVPSAPAVNPVGDESGTWLPATLAYGAPLATSSSPGLMQPDGITTFVNSSGVLSTTLDPSWIGVPRYWRSTTLPPNHCWANGDFVEFADWPQLEQVYNAGGFAGMLMAWDADSETQAANLGQWRPDAANPTGLFTPNLGGQFFRNWVQETGAGGTNRPGVPEIDGHLNFGVSDGVGTGAFRFIQGTSYGQLSPTTIAAYSFDFAASRCSSVYGNADTVMPASVNLPVCFYLGWPA